MAVLLTIALLAVAAQCAGATAPPDSNAKEVTLFFRSQTNDRNVLELKVLPEKGVAVVQTFEGGGLGSGRGVNYAIAMPPAPFDGHLDVHFPRLGEFVGTGAPGEALGPAAQAKLCKSAYSQEGATFEGRIAFQGAGGYGHWEATRVPAGILLGCGAEPKRENGPGALFSGAASGPVLDGPSPIRLFARGEVRHRFIEFITWAGHTSNRAEILAVDREWLPGEVATERWAKKESASLKKTVTLAAGRNPPSATFTPPAPFFGRGSYLGRAGKLSGSIGVHFLGLTLHLTPTPLEATLIDEDSR